MGVRLGITETWVRPAGPSRLQNALRAAVLLPILVTLVFTVRMVRDDVRFHRFGSPLTYPVGVAPATQHLVDLNVWFLAPLNATSLLPGSIEPERRVPTQAFRWLRLALAIGLVATGWFLLGNWVDRVRSGKVAFPEPNFTRTVLRGLLGLVALLTGYLLYLLMQLSTDVPTFGEVYLHEAAILIVPVLVGWLGLYELRLIQPLARSCWIPSIVALMMASLIFWEHSAKSITRFTDVLNGLNAPALLLTIPALILNHWIDDFRGVPSIPYHEPVALFAIPSAVYWFAAARLLLAPNGQQGWRSETFWDVLRVVVGILFFASFVGLLFTEEGNSGLHFWSTCSCGLFLFGLRRRPERHEVSAGWDGSLV